MALDNNTEYCMELRTIGSSQFSSRSCMSFVKAIEAREQVHLIVRKERLHNELSTEDIDRWLEIGNSLSFKATSGISEFYNPNLLRHTQLLTGLDFEPSSVHVLNQYGSLGARSIRKAKIASLSADSVSTFYILSALITDSTMKEYNGLRWSINTRDFVVSETKEPLTERITRRIQELEAERMPNNDSMHKYITLKNSDYSAGKHLLAALTFYRLLWSGNYKGVVRNTLDLIDSGVPAWEALSYSWARHEGDPYFGFSARGFLFNNKDVVINDLSKDISSYINSAFTKPGAELRKLSIADISKYLKVPSCSSIVCLNGKNAKTLTLNKEYKSKFTIFGENKNNSRLQIVCDDGKVRSISKNRFKLTYN